jgi:hypothetical protein
MTPKVMNPSIDTEEDFIKVPSITRSRTLMAQAVGVSLTELETPCSDCLVRERNATHR